MTREQKLEALYEIFETEEIGDDTPLAELRWDSMTIMSVMVSAMNDGKKLTAAELRSLGTVGQVLDLM